MGIALIALFVFGILTLWIPAYWPVAVFQVGVFALCGLLAWRARFAGWRLSYPAIPLALAVLWGILQLATGHTVYAFATQTAILKWATFLGIFIVASAVVRDPDGVRWLRSAMLWLAFGIAILATLQTFTSGGDVFWLFPSGYKDRVMGPFVSPNDYCSFVIAVLPFAVYEMFRRESGNYMLNSLMAAVMYASVIAAASRAGAILATIEILAVAGLMLAKRKVRGGSIAAALLRIAAVFLIFSLVVGWSQLWKRFSDLALVDFRHELNTSSLKMVEANPFWGTGLGTWPTVYPEFAVIDVGVYANQAHNDWLQWTAEGGIPLALVLATLAVWALPRAIRSVWGLGAIAVFAHAVVDYPFSRVALGAWAFAVLGLLSTSGPRGSGRRGRSRRRDERFVDGSGKLAESAASHRD